MMDVFSDDQLEQAKQLQTDFPTETEGLELPDIYVAWKDTSDASGDVWTAVDPDDPTDVERVRQSMDRYRDSLEANP